MKNAQKKSRIDEVWRLLFDEEMINEIVNLTKQKMKTIRQKLKEQQFPNYKDTDVMEIKGLI